ncbi:MAG: OmpA family protein [Myxococcota bacterium]
MLILCASAALALDAHGTPAMPAAGNTAADPLVTWQPATAAPGSLSFAATLEGARSPLVGTVQTGEELAEVALLSDLLGTTFTGMGTVGDRVGLAVSLPVWWRYDTFDTEAAARSTQAGAFLGDVHAWVPVTLVHGGDGLGLVAIADVSLPTGDAARRLGGGFGGGARVAVGRDGMGFNWGANAGIAYDADALDLNVDRTVTVPLAAQIGWQPWQWGGLGVEAWASPSLTADDAFAVSSPGELLLRAGVRTKSGVFATLAGGGAFTPGVGASEARLYLRLGWGKPRPEKATVEPTVEKKGEPGAYDLVVDARDADGKPVAAVVTVEGPAQLPPVELGRDGHAVVPLSPGEWTVTLAGEGLETQRREVALEEGRWRPAEVDAVLRPAEGGAASLVVEVVDVEGRAVEGARVTVDGGERGETSTGGSLALEGLKDGDRALVVAAADFEAADAIALSLGGGDNKRVVVLERPPGSVKVIARSKDGPVSDALVRFLGPRDVAPLPIGPGGEAMVQLAPGNWLVAVSAPRHGLQEREVAIAPDDPALVVVDVLLGEDERGDGGLTVRVLDPDGSPVVGAEVRLDDALLGTTGNGGTVSVSGLQAGSRTLAVRGPRFRDLEPRAIAVGGGAREVEVVLAWKPGTVHVRARGADGALPDTLVRFDGPEPRAPEGLGPDGDAFFQLAPGTWQVALSSPELGLQVREVRVLPDDIHLVDIDATLLRAAGDATLALTVVGPDGKPVDGAVVRVDGREAGATSTGGTLRLGNLAAGRHKVAVEGPLFKAWSKDVTFKAGEAKVDVKLAWDAAAVKVRARSADGAVTDALARFYGADALPPTPLGEGGERLFGLEPGPWTLVLSSPRYGLAQQELTVKPSSEPRLVEVSLTPPAADQASLLVVLVDPAGNPVEGATLTVAGEPHALGRSGVYVLAGATPGTVAVAAEAPGFAPVAAKEVALVAGLQQQRVTMKWLPRPVRVAVTDKAGKPVDAQVRFAGPNTVAPALAAGGKAEAELLPGDWQVLVSATDLGARSQELVVPPGAGPLDLTVALDAVKVQVTNTQVVIREQVHFDFDAATIQADSFRVLEEVAAALQLHPELLRVEVQGHTDAVGDEAYNVDLSQRRAESVRAWLVEHGVDAARLVAKGYGTSQPVGRNDTEAGRKANRRVQFVIVEQKP